uniref:Cation transporter n=1 Tax=Desulfobacca acetoxidans TaxID=60893 RepID=A0A7V4G6J1_9BACT
MNIISSYVHALDGRLRIKIPEVKNAPPKAREVEQHLKLSPGVDQVSANPVTGNVLILYNPRLIGQEEIILALKELGYLEEGRPQGPGAPGMTQDQGGFLTKVTTTVASTLMEVALSRLVAALI